MKHRLVLINGPAPGASLELNQDAAPITIGRDASRDFPLDDHLASRLHARVWFDGHAWQIEDCGSHNGTTVNSQAISRSLLVPGDLVRIGDRLIIFLGESEDANAWNLSPSVLAASTSAVRIPSPDKRAELLEELRADTSSRPVRLLSVLYRLSSDLYVQADVDQLAQTATETLREAIGAETANLWLADVDGRLRRFGGAACADARGGEDRVLAVIAVENDEAILMCLNESAHEQAADGNTEHSSSEADSSAIAVPIPARQRPRGAFECFRPAAAGCFGRDDLQFVVAVAHQFGTALENLEHRMELEQANEQLRVRLAAETRLYGNSEKIRQLHEQISRVAPATSTVLILGESGTGKELISQMIHELSPPFGRPLRGRQLRRFQRIASGKRALRPRAGRVHRRATAAAGPIRAGPPRHYLPRRDRRDQSRLSGQIAQTAGRTRFRTPGRRRIDPRRRADRSSNTPQPAEIG